jgi:hypothetical protein
MSAEKQIQKVKLVGVRGDTWIRNLIFKDSAGTVINITGWLIFMTIKSSVNLSDADAEGKKTVSLHTDPTNGASQIRFEASETADLSGDYVTDIQVKKADGTIFTVCYGTINFLEDTTRRIV